VILAVVLDLFVAFHGQLGAIFEREHVSRVLQVFLLDEHALEGFRIEAEGRATLQPLLVGVKIDVLERLVLEVRRHVRRLRNG